jgi:hypothetical protein
MAAAASEDGSRRVLIRAASNIGPNGDGVEYSLHQDFVPGETFKAQRIRWGDVVKGEAKKILEELRNASDKLNEAKRFLSELLQEHGITPTSEIRKAADANGYAWMTIKRAKDELKIEAFKNTGSKTAPWSWRLPDPRPGEEEPYITVLHRSRKDLLLPH